MAGNSKRKLKGRRISKRNENKRYRAADKQVIDGGHSRLVRPDKWALRPRQPLLDIDQQIDDRSEMHYPASEPKQKQKKDKHSPYCPAREGQKHHHFMTDTREVPNWSGFGRAYEDQLIFERLADAGLLDRRHYHRQIYKLCAYCGEERVVSRRRS